MVLLFILIIGVSSIAYYYKTSHTTKIRMQAQIQGDGSEESKKETMLKEKIICDSTINRKCYRYRCETGYFPEINPPGGPGLCSDGSTPTRLEEVNQEDVPSYR